MALLSWKLNNSLRRSRRRKQDSEADSCEHMEYDTEDEKLENINNQSEDAAAAAHVALESDIAQLQVRHSLRLLILQKENALTHFPGKVA